MYRLVCFGIFLRTLSLNYGTNKTSEGPRREANVYDVADILLTALQPGDNTTNVTGRLPELREKLSRVESYVVDRDQYAELLLNQTRHCDLNETNFFKALQEPDNFLARNDSKNLYLKMKERMNRDDLMQILAERGKPRMKMSARRMMDEHVLVKRRHERKLDEVVDKYLGEAPHDDHKFYENDTGVKVWDPVQELEERQEYHQPDGRRIFKGERTTIRYYPFMVSIHIMGRFWCGGSLYADDIVITSASCLQLMHNNRFFRENPRALSVRVGSNHSRIGGELIDALEVYFYPAYNPRTLNNNIAVIRLQRRLKLSYHRVPVIIPLAMNEGGLASTSEVLLLGWGVTKTSQKLQYEPIYLQRKFLPVYPNMFCKEVYGDKFVQETMFCAGTVSTGEGACDHDAGGPAVLDGYLVGIISYGPTVCGFPDAPTVFTMISAYVDWIETVDRGMRDYYRGRKRTTTTTLDPFIEYFHTSTMNPMDQLLRTLPQQVLDVLTQPAATTTQKALTIQTTTDSKPVDKPIGRSQTDGMPRVELQSNFKITPRGTEQGKEDGMFIDFGDKSGKSDKEEEEKDEKPENEDKEDKDKEDKDDSD